MCSESLFTCGVVARLLLLTQQPCEALSPTASTCPFVQNFQLITCDAQILSATLVVFGIIPNEDSGEQQLSDLRSMLMRAQDRQVSYISRRCFSLFSSSTFLAGLVFYALILPRLYVDNVHRLTFQPISCIPKPTFPGRSNDRIDLQLSVHIFALQDFSTTEFLSRSNAYPMSVCRLLFVK